MSGVDPRYWNILGFFAAIALYFLPYVIANARHHRNSQPILLLNLFLGWTGLGWISALIWSATSQEVRHA